MKIRYFLRLTAILTMFLLPNRRVHGQYYQLGADPSSAVWRTIGSDHFNIIYPEQIDSLARRYLFLFEKNRNLNNTGLKIETPVIPIVLHPWKVESNGTVVWAPKRTELYTTPPYANVYAQNWDEQLSVHEGRHIGQMAHYTKGIYRFLNAIGGEQTIAIGVGFYPSRSFLEGDAVANETDFSRAGRGRSADFLMYYRAAFDAGDFRKYDRWKYGSQIKYTPNRYAFGYFLMMAHRTRSGNYFTTGDIMDKQVEWWYDFFNVSRRSYKYATGYSNRQNFRYIVNVLDSTWKADAIEREPYTETVSLLKKHERYYTDYTDYIPTENGSLALKSGMEYSKYLVNIDTLGRPHNISPFSTSTSRLVYDGKNTVLFSECVPDPRWELRSYSIIRSYDVEKGKFRDVTSKTRFFNPSFTPSGKSAVAVEYKVEGGSAIVEVDIESGEVLKRIDAPSGYQFTEASVANDTLYAVAVTPDGMGVFRLDNDGWKNVITEQSRAIRNFQADQDGKLRFVSDLCGVSDIYSYNSSNGSLKLDVSAKFGTTTPYFRKDTVFFSNFTHMGYRPVSAVISEEKSSDASFDKPYVYELAEQMASQARENTVQMKPEEEYELKNRIDTLESRHYSKIGHMFNLHSWAPFYANIDRIMNLSFEHIYQLAAPGVTLISQNNLGTMVTTGGYAYHGGFHSGHINVNYSGLYPVIELAADYNDRKKTHTFIDSEKNYITDTLDRAAIDISANIYIPFNLSKGGWNSGFIPQIKFTYSNDTYSIEGTSNNALNQSVLYSARYYRILSTPPAKLTPRWGFGIVTSLERATGADNFTGTIGYINLYGYLPGITRNQGIKLSISRQQQFQKNETCYLPNVASMPRGFSNRILRDYSKFTFDYSIPIYAFEGACSFLGYLKRFNLTPFTDIAFDRTKGTQEPFLYSYGSIFTAKFHFLKFGWTFDMGVRYSRTSEDKNDFQIVFSSAL